MDWFEQERFDWLAYLAALDELREMQERVFGIAYDMLLRDIEGDRAQ